MAKNEQKRRKKNSWVDKGKQKKKGKIEKEKEKRKRKSGARGKKCFVLIYFVESIQNRALEIM